MFFKMSEILFCRKVRIFHKHWIKGIRAGQLKSNLKFVNINFIDSEFRFRLSKFNRLSFESEEFLKIVSFLMKKLIILIIGIKIDRKLGIIRRQFLLSWYLIEKIFTMIFLWELIMMLTLLFTTRLWFTILLASLFVIW